MSRAWGTRLHTGVLNVGIWEWLFGSPAEPTGPLLRDFRISGAARDCVLRRCTPEERMAFAELLLRLDGDPIGHSRPVVRAPTEPGLRWARIPGHTVLLTIDAARDRINIVSVGASPRGGDSR